MWQCFNNNKCDLRKCSIPFFEMVCLFFDAAEMNCHSSGKESPKFVGQQPVFSCMLCELFLYTLASIPGEPTIVVAHSLGAQVRGGNEQASD